MESLQAVFWHRAVDFLQHIEPHFHTVILVDADDVAIKRRVMELAECQTVGHFRLALGITVSQNVRGFKQLLDVAGGKSRKCSR